MHTRRPPTRWLIALFSGGLLHAEPAFAYLDPNVGGLLFQIFAPLLAVVIAFWGRIKLVCAHVVAKVKRLFSRGH